MNSFSQLFTKIDFLGSNFGFENQGSTRFRSIQGACFSVITFAAALVIIIMFGREVYERKSPNVSLSEERLEDSKVMMSEFPFALTFFNTSGRELKNPEELFMFRITKSYVNKTNLAITTYSNYTLIKCKDQLDKFTKNQIIIKNYTENTILTPYCVNFDENMYFENDYALPGSTFINIYVTMCNKRFSPLCKYDESMKRLINDAGGLQITTSFLDAYIDSSSFDSPVNYFRNINSLIVGPGMVKLFYLRITNDLYSSDDGWIIEDKRNIKYYKKSSFYVDSNFDDNPIIYAVILSSPNIRLKYVRSYLKVQELLARVGGIANAFTIIIYFITYHYLRFKYIFYIRENSFESIQNLKLSSENKGFNYLIAENKKFENIEQNNLSKDNPSKKFTENVQVNNYTGSHNVNRLVVNDLKNNNTKDNFISNNDSEKCLDKKSIMFIQEINSMFINKIKVEEGNINNNTNKFPVISNFSYYDYICSHLICQTVKRNSVDIEIKKVESFLNVNNFLMFLIKNYYSYFKDINDGKFQY
jgi:hypothetical protein